MKLIQLILNNWFIIVVFYFIVSSLLRRGKGTAKETPAKPAGRSMPPFGGGQGSGWGNKRPVLSRGNSSPEASSKELDGRRMPSAEHKPSIKPSLQEQTPAAVEAEARRRESLPGYGDHLLKPKDRIPNQAERRPHTEQGANRTSAQRLAEGVLWAEILGPPRSKKPLR